MLQKNHFHNEAGILRTSALFMGEDIGIIFIGIAVGIGVEAPPRNVARDLQRLTVDILLSYRPGGSVMQPGILVPF